MRVKGVKSRLLLLLCSIMSDTQQVGPPTHPDSNTEVPAIEQMDRQQLEQLARSLLARGSSGTRSGVSTESAATSLFVPGASQVTGDVASRALSAVQAIPPPEGGVWQGFKDSRSVKRFLDSVSKRVQACGLGAHAAFYYLINRCLEPGLAEELLDNCPTATGTDFTVACSEATRYLTETFRLTNSSGRFTEKVESLTWTKECEKYDQYRHAFHKIVREAELLDVPFTEDNKRRLFLKGMPEKLRHQIEERWDDDLPLEKLMQKVEGITIKGDYFKKMARGAAVGSGGPASPTKGPKCFGCGEFGHIKVNCKRSPQPVSKSKEADVTDIPWEVSPIRLAGTRADGRSPYGTVVIQGARGEARGVRVKALLDTGAQLTCCSRRLADHLYRTGIVTLEDVTKGSDVVLALADVGYQLKPLGSVKVTLEGEVMDVLVLNSKLCSDLIIGFDEITRNPRIRQMFSDVFGERSEDLPQEKTNRAMESDERREANRSSNFVSGMSVVATADAVAPQQASSPEHCHWPDVKLRWKPGARESLKPNIREAMGQAKQLEVRLSSKAPKLLEAYQEVLDSWTANGWLEKIGVKDVKYCLKHFAVAKDPDGPTAMSRCRVVVDGSGLKKRMEADECSHTDAVRNIILWRTADVFVCVDISQAYMRVPLHDEDASYLCIFWRGEFLRFRSLPMGISPSAAILQGVVDTFIAEYERDFAVNGVEVAFAPYMDDITQLGWLNLDGEGSFADVEDQMEKDMCKFLDDKGMKVSYSKTFNSRSMAGGVLGVKYRGGFITPSSKLQQQLAKGDLTLRENIKKAVEDLNRRGAVSLLSKFWDPLGLHVEIAMASRVVTSKLSGLAWDAKVSRSVAAEVGKLVEASLEVMNSEEPRKLDPSRVFIFTDASHIGIAAVAVCRDEKGKWRRLCARARMYKKHQKEWCAVSSKIELLAMQEGLFLAQYLKRVLEKIPENRQPVGWFFGTDSEVNLNRFSARAFERLEDRWERKVAVCVNNAISRLNGAVFHVPGAINPSDAASRGTVKAVNHEAAVNWFKEDRAVRPVKYILREDETKGEIPELAPVTRINNERERAHEKPLCLQERYRSESDGSSMNEWIRKYQEAEQESVKLVSKLKLEDGVYVARFWQNVQGEWCSPIYIPKDLRANVLVSVHDKRGHLGISKTARVARVSFYWPGLMRDVRVYVAKCHICQQIKGERVWGSDPKAVSAGGAWNVVGIDTVKGFETSDVLLTVTCLYTRYCFTMVMTRETTQLVSWALDHLFTIEGPPRVLMSDNAEIFKSNLFASLMTAWGIEHRFVPRYAPWYGGFYEITHRTLVKVLAAVMMESKVSNWRDAIKLATYLYNCRPYESSSPDALSPQEVFRGRRSVMWKAADIDYEEALHVDNADEQEIKAIQEARAKIYEEFETVWMEMRNKSAREIARKERRIIQYKVGDLVMVFVPRFLRKKVDPKWQGPHRIERKVSDCLWVVNGKEEHVYNLKLVNQQEGESRQDKKRAAGRHPDNAESRNKKARLRCLLLLMGATRGELLWI